MDRDALYQEHLNEMFGNRVIEDYSDAEILRVLQRLLSCLPNGGKLYKYRHITGEDFDHAYDALKNGYIWLSTADRFNDDEDCTLLYDLETEAESLKEYISNHPDKIIKRVAHDIGIEGDFESSLIKEVLNCYDKTIGRIKKKKALSFLLKHGCDRETSLGFINEAQRLTDDIFSQNSSTLEQIVTDFLHFNQTLRAKSYVCSLSEQYDSNTMWAHYADSNQGFCIEYDFSKSLTLPIEIQRLLISTYRVVYKEEKEPFSFIHTIDCFLGDRQGTEEFRQISYEILTQLITKKIEWQYEKEWRVFLFHIQGNRLLADLVSRIIIDERIINTDNAQKLISLAKERGWNLTVRTKNLVQTAHKYISYQAWEYRRSSDA